MDNSGIFNLGDATVSAEVTESVITSGASLSGATQAFIDRLDGMTAVGLFVEFVYGSGGTTCAVVVETSLSQGADWIDVARFEFTTATAQKTANLSGLLSNPVAAVAALAVEGVQDGILGDRLRVRITSTGTYAGATSVSVRAAVR